MSVAESILRKLLDKITEELKYDHAEISLKELTSGGANYTSVLYTATVAAPNKDSLNLFAKVANVNEKLREAVNLDVIFKTEQFVYHDLVKIYEKIQDKHNISPEHRFVFPKFYGGNSTQGEETIVMEDLMAQGYGMYTRFKSVDWEYAAAAVEHLARFHALSFAYQKEDPENFAKDAERVKCITKDESHMEGTWIKMVGAAVQATKEEHRERLGKFLGDKSGRDQYQKFRMPISTTVLCHGDYRVSNLLSRRQNGRLDLIVVDYQTVHSGCPATDLLYFEYLGTDQEFRRENHERLINHYFMELTAALDRLGIDVNEVYPRETFEKELKEMLGPALRVTSIILPLVLVEAENQPHMGGIKHMDDFVLTPSELFGERYSELVSDCIAWGVL